MPKEFIEAVKNFQFPLDLPGHYLAGGFTACLRGALVKEIINPSNGLSLGTIRLDKSLLDKAFETAKSYESSLRAMSLTERFATLRKFRQGFVDFQTETVIAMQVEAGKPEWEAKQEFDGALRFLDQMLSQEATLFQELIAPLKTNQTGVDIQLEPVGTVFAHIPFSTPCTSFVKFFAVNLVAGNPLVIMASAHASLFTTVMAHVAEVLQLPSGMLAMLCGSFELFRTGCQDKRVKAVIYLGSKEHCTTIRQENFEVVGRPVMLQSGGKNSVLIHPSAAMETAAKIVLYGTLKSAGQLCSSTSRVFVSSSQLPEFTDILVSMLRNLEIGPTDTAGANPDMGPLYARKAVDKFLRFQTMAKRESKKTLQWGKAVDTGSGGFFVNPGVHILESFEKSSAYQRNVLLFPDIAVYEYSDLEAAVAGVNSTDAPLVTSIITQDFAFLKEHRFVSPNIAVNCPTVEEEAQLPVAGRGPCGSVRQNGMAMVENLTYPCAVMSVTEEPLILKDWPRHRRP